MGDRYLVRPGSRVVIEVEEDEEARLRALREEAETGGESRGLLPNYIPQDTPTRRVRPLKIEVYYIPSEATAASVWVGETQGRTISYPGFWEGATFGAEGVSRAVWEAADAPLIAAAGVPLISPVGGSVPANVSLGASASPYEVDGSLHHNKLIIKRASRRSRLIAAGGDSLRSFNTFTDKVTEIASPDAPEATFEIPAGAIVRVYLAPELYVASLGFKPIGAGDARKTITGGDLWGRTYVWSGQCSGVICKEITRGVASLWVAAPASPLDLYGRFRGSSRSLGEPLTRGAADFWLEKLAGVDASGLIELYNIYYTTPRPFPETVEVIKSLLPNCAGNAYIQATASHILAGSTHLAGEMVGALGQSLDVRPPNKVYEGRFLGRFEYETSSGDVSPTYYVWERADRIPYPPSMFGGSQPRAYGYGAVPVLGMTPFRYYVGDLDSTDTVLAPAPVLC